MGTTESALPLLVVKIGGAAGIALEHVCADVTRVLSDGHSVVLVHGGSDETNRLSEQLGRPARFITSPSGFTSRYTDRATLEIFAMATAGKINTLLVEALQRNGVNALGLSGADGRLMVAKRKDAIRAVVDGKTRVVRDDHTGTILSVNAELMGLLLAAGYTPVVAPLAITNRGELLNVDADRAAAMIAAALHAETLVLLTNVPGLLRGFPDERTLIPRLSRESLDQALAMAEGRMKKKILGAREALEGGVARVAIADARVERPVSAALGGGGTLIA
jgi:acetylglutamate/LysW-gamma-L-alpha-aminoadipate kinase